MQKVTAGAMILMLALTACGPVGSELDGNLEINGMDPVFWGAKVDRKAGTTTITVTGARDLTGGLPSRSPGDKGAVILTTKTPDGDFAVTLRAEPCKDGLSEGEYSWSAAVKWQGETLKGCARPA